jgi:hypothetical protein
MKEPSERAEKVKKLRAVARGYRALKKDKAKVYDAAADVLERDVARNGTKQQPERHV